MNQFSGRIREVHLGDDQNTSALIECSPVPLPIPGQYFQAWSASDPDPVLPVSLFPSHRLGSIVEKSGSLLFASGSIPASWQPGVHLILSGPLGQGFRLPTGIRKLGLVALGNSLTRLLPLVDEALQLHGGYGYFNDYAIERFYRAAKVLEIYEGTKEIEKIVISREILGKL